MSQQLMLQQKESQIKEQKRKFNSIISKKNSSGARNSSTFSPSNNSQRVSDSKRKGILNQSKHFKRHTRGSSISTAQFLNEDPAEYFNSMPRSHKTEA